MHLRTYNLFSKNFYIFKEVLNIQKLQILFNSFPKVAFIWSMIIPLLGSEILVLMILNHRGLNPQSRRGLACSADATEVAALIRSLRRDLPALVKSSRKHGGKERRSFLALGPNTMSIVSSILNYYYSSLSLFLICIRLVYP